MPRLYLARRVRSVSSSHGLREAMLRAYHKLGGVDNPILASR